MMAFSTRAPRPMTQPVMMTQPRTVAPGSTTTLRERIESATVPMMWQPPETMEFVTREPASYLAGGLSWAFVMMVRSGGNSWSMTAGSSISRLRL